jgi:hypothetical protein
MDHRTAAHSAPTQILEQQSDDTAARPARAGRRRPPTGIRRPIAFLVAAAAGAVVVGAVASAEPAAQADAAAEPASVAEQLGLRSQSASTIVDAELPDRLGELAATRSQREAEQAAAAQTQAAADQAAIDARLAEEARLAEQARLAEEARKAEEARVAEEARKAEEARRAAAAARPAAAPARSSGSYQDYALSKLGGDGKQFSCLESLWGKESGWNPNAQNRSSTAYGIPQFLNSTWAGTGIAKTSDGYRQIDAGLIYIDSRYGSPCGAWAHSKANNWY